MMSTIISLITEGETLRGKIRDGQTQWGVDEFGNDVEYPIEYVFYNNQDYDKYQLWIKKSIRYLENNYQDKYLSNEFIKKSKQALNPYAVKDMIQILQVYEEETSNLSTQKEVPPKHSTDKCVFHKKDVPVRDDFIFVLMPFTENWSDFVWDKQIKLIVENISEISLLCQRADDLFGRNVMQDIYDSIASASIIIADTTGKNPNVFYELGIADMLEKDVILISQEADDIPFDLKGSRHCIYSFDGRSKNHEKLKEYIPNTIIDILKKRKQ